MANLIWIGAGISMLGLCGIIFSMVRVAGARRAGLNDEELRQRIAKIIPLNMGSLLLSVLGLMCVVIGITLS